MQDKLEDFIKDNKAAFDTAEPDNRVWNKIDQALDHNKVKTINSSVWYWRVAVAVLLIAVVYLAADKFSTGQPKVEELSTLQEKCIIVNVSRAQLIDIDALKPLLINGHVLAAGFDVHVTEPTTGFEDHLGYPNVVASPHTAGATLDTYHMALKNCIDNIRLALAGETPNWIVNQTAQASQR